MHELNARLRVEGLDDATASARPVKIDAEMLQRMVLSTWRTDAGDFDVLAEIPARDGSRRRYEHLVDNALEGTVVGITVRAAALDDIIASKQWANRPKDRAALPELEQLARDQHE